MTNKAKVAEVKYGFTIVEGLLQNDQYGIAVPQICDFFSVPQKNSSRYFKTLLGEDFSFLKWKSELNSKEVNVISLKDFAKLTVLLAVKGNDIALKFTLAAVEEAHERRFDIAFNKKITEEERNERMKVRVEGKESRLTFTNAIKSYIDRNGITGNEAKFLYKNATDKLYSCLTGYSSTKQFREKENIPLKHSPRDYASANDLIHTNEVESAAARWIFYKNIHPYDAVEYCTNQLLLTKVGWNTQSRL